MRKGGFRAAFFLANGKNSTVVFQRSVDAVRMEPPKALYINRVGELHRHPEEIIGIGTFDFNGNDVALAEWAAGADMDVAVDFGGVPLRAAFRDGGAGFIDDDLDALADAGFETCGADCLLGLHEAVPAVLFDVFRDMGEADIVRGRAFDGLVFETADSFEFGFFQPIEQEFEIGVCFAGEADDECGADGEIGADFAPGVDAVERLFLIAGAFHRFEDGRRSVLEGNIEIGQHEAFGHQRDDIINMGVGIDVMEADPCAELAEFAGEIDEFGADLAIFPLACGIFDVETVGGRILRDDEEFLDASIDEFFRFAEHITDGAGDEISAQFGDDAKRATIVATL